MTTSSEPQQAGCLETSVALPVGLPWCRAVLVTVSMRGCEPQRPENQERLKRMADDAASAVCGYTSRVVDGTDGRPMPSAHAVELGTELEAAIERGRELHSWLGYEVQRAAVVAECAELLIELSKADIDIARVRAEALDVFVCAERLMRGW